MQLSSVQTTSDGLEKLEGPVVCALTCLARTRPHPPSPPAPGCPVRPPQPLSRSLPSPRVTWQVNGHSPIASLGQPVQRAQVLPGWRRSVCHAAAARRSGRSAHHPRGEPLGRRGSGPDLMAPSRCSTPAIPAAVLVPQNASAHGKQGGCPREGRGLSCSSKRRLLGEPRRTPWVGKHRCYFCLCYCLSALVSSSELWT